MTENKKQNDWIAKITGYFTSQELLIIVALAVMAFLTANFGLAYMLPGGPGSGFAHGFLKLPGPGAGIFHVSAFICFWLVAGLLLIKKPGTAILISTLILIFSLIIALARVGIVRLDYLALVVAIIIECAGLLPFENKPWTYIFPSILGIMGIVTLALWLSGDARMGEDGALATVFPLGYVVCGILALGFAVICWSYPMKYIVGAGIAEMFYITFMWLFNGKSGFASWLPVTPAIPPLLTFALVSGAFMALLAYLVFLLWNTYAGQGAAKV